jgi:hypothetical protein
VFWHWRFVFSEPFDLHFPSRNGEENSELFVSGFYSHNAFDQSFSVKCGKQGKTAWN